MEKLNNNIIKSRNLIRFLYNPKKYISDLIIYHSNRIVRKLLNSEFFYTIDNFLPQDIFIVGYPKSGNTWMQSLISGLIYGIDTRYLPDKLAQEIVPDVHARKIYKRFGNINFFKSHHLPKPEYKNVIYLVRDGRDALVSYFHFNMKLGIQTSLEEMVKEGKGLYPSKWHEHVEAWLQNPYKSNMLIVKYEDLLKNAVYELQRVCEFINIERDTDLIERVVKGNDFANMKKKAEKYGGLGHKNWLNEKGKDFFRSGKSGTYKNDLPDHLIEYINHEAEYALRYFNYIK